MQRERKVTPHNTRFPVKGAPIDPGLLRLKKVSLGLGTQSSFCKDKYLCKFLFFSSRDFSDEPCFVVREFTMIAANVNFLPPQTPSRGRSPGPKRTVFGSFLQPLLDTRQKPCGRRSC